MVVTGEGAVLDGRAHGGQGGGDHRGRLAASTRGIATNSAFSNPTRDWVAEFNRGHERPAAVLWQRSDLEQMLVANPSALLRVAPEALSAQGMAVAVRERSGRAARIPAEGELRLIWEHRDDLELDALTQLALAAGEREHGRLVERPWIMSLDDEHLLEVCGVGLTNLPALVWRAIRMGTGEAPIFRLGEHLVSAVLARMPPKAAEVLLTAPWSALESEDRERSEDDIALLRAQIYDPIAWAARRALGCACANDCPRMVPGGDEPGENVLGTLRGETPATATRGIIDIEMPEEPCGVGLPLGDDQQCPWFRDAPLADVLDEVQFALRARLAAVGDPDIG